MSTTDPASTTAPLLWTVGFSGKRNLSAAQEQHLRTGLRGALDFLLKQAAQQVSRLTAVSSVARGGDVLFAECCLTPGPDGKPLAPWKGLLPFGEADFFRLDLRDAGAEQPARLAAARRCLEQSYPGEGVNVGDAPGCDPDDKDDRDAAYMSCGYRTVDEADVMIFAVLPEEWRRVADAKNSWEREMSEWSKRNRDAAAEWEKWSRGMRREGHQPRPPDLPPPPPFLRLDGTDHKAGTLSTARYALAAKRPCIFLNVDAPDPWQDALLVKAAAARDWFVDPMVTPVMKSLLEKSGPLRTGGDGRQTLEDLHGRLNDAANAYQNEARQGLSATLRWHLLASSIAAVLATVLHLGDAHWRMLHAWSTAGQVALWLIVLLALLKPLLALRAMRREAALHHAGTRGNWVHHRILAEVCRGALGRWGLPRQPLDALDEEDFPKIKRLIRSLRLIRELADKQVKAQIPGPAEVLPGETAAEAVFREACRGYAKDRLEEQAQYYGGKRWEALRTEHCWHRWFKISLWTAVTCGSALVVYKLTHVLHAPQTTGDVKWPHANIFEWIAALAIIAPFYATYALGKLTITDCRRRAARYDEMHHYLLRLAATLNACQAIPSRLRLIEQAERMMIEEQHEWFSVTRNFSV